MKLLACGLIVICSYFIGATLCEAEGDKLKTLDALYSLFSEMLMRISGERAPLYRIFAEAESEQLERIGFLPLLRSQRGISVSVWEKAVGTLGCAPTLTRELDLFGAELGRLALDEQIKRIEACRASIAEHRDMLARELPDRQKSTKAVCLLAGLMTAIILL